MPVFAQNASASISSTVTDSTGAVVPKAKVTLKNEASGITRETVTNGAGVFNFPAVPPGSYTVTVSNPGFQATEIKNLVLTQGASVGLPAIALQVEGTRQEVAVVAASDVVVPTDTGHTSQTLNTRMIEDLSIVGRDAAELIKIMPGMGMNGGLSQSMWNSYTTATNTGPIGSFTANGTQPYGAMTMTSDGANLLDPGNQGTQTANINQNQVQEVSILTSAYGAEFAKGPVTFQAIGKSGGSQFHGQAYLYARNSTFNSMDSYVKNQGAPKPEDSYYYPGGDFGGPVIIPGTGFNRNHDKLFFYTAYEYMKQQPAGYLKQDFVPTAEMLGGNFSPAYLQGLGPAFASNHSPANQVPGGNAGASNFPGGMIPPSQIDPNSIAYMKTFPQPNTDPLSNSNGANWQQFIGPPQNRWEFRIRGDWNISEKTKLFFSWNRQSEQVSNPIGIWWTMANSLPYPSSQDAAQKANVYSANLVHVFSPTLTNEFVFATASFLNPIKLGDPAAVDPAKLGMQLTPFWQNPFDPQIPNTFGWNNAMVGYATYPYGAPWPAGGQHSFGKLSQTPNISDNLSKVLGTHTLKAGFYWDFARNDQTGGGYDWTTQGAADFENWGATSTGNPLADMVTGRITQFNQVQYAPVGDFKYYQYSWYVNDQWKATRRLTITAGLRFEHMGNWVPSSGPGLAVWDGSKYDNSSSAPGWTGLQWNAINSSIPMSGFPSKGIFYEPRVGAAYDLFGDGRTVLRGGWGRYRYQLALNSVSAAAYSAPLGYQQMGTTWGCCVGWNNFNQYSPSLGAPGLGTGVNGVMTMGDNRTPYTDTFNFTISQRAPWHSVAEFQYSGNRSKDMLLRSSLTNLNNIPMGAFFGPDPITGVINDPSAPNFPVNDYYPLHNYTGMTLVGHGSYSNYNAFIASWQKQAGKFTFTLNYTFSKVLGIRDGNTDNGNGAGVTLYPYAVAPNYGVLAYDHTQIFNAAYVVNLPSPVHNNKFVGGVVNGWVLSGITQAQSGAPIQPNTNGNLNVQWPGDFTNQRYLGTNAVGIFPKVTCDPRSNLQSGQYFNPSCFTAPTGGANGDIIWPYIKGPSYFNSDLAIYKNFRITERQKLQLRFSAFNFLNHPLPQFNAAGGNNDVQLNFIGANGSMSPTNVNPLTTGSPRYTVGRRVIEFAVKYNF